MEIASTDSRYDIKSTIDAYHYHPPVDSEMYRSIEADLVSAKAVLEHARCMEYDTTEYGQNRIKELLQESSEMANRALKKIDAMCKLPKDSRINGHPSDLIM